MPTDHRMDRRRFAGGLAAGTGAFAAAQVLPLCATDDRPPATAKEKDQEKQPDEPAAKPSPEVLLLTLLTQQYPSEHYDEAALQGIYRDLHGDLARGKLLSEFPLKNSDEPSSIFRVFRGPDQPL